MLAECANSFESNTQQLIDGILRYSNTLNTIQQSENIIISRIGSSSLNQYSESGTPILIVPSMINKPYIMDLGEHSLIKALISQGFRPFMIDWGEPYKMEIEYNLSDYIDRLMTFALHTSQISKSKITMLGYCMGGFMIDMYLCKHPNLVNIAVHIGTPWDFSHNSFIKIPFNKLEKLFDTQKFIPKEFFQTAFYITQFSAVHSKYQSFSSKNHDDFAFIIESWVNDGISMPKNVLRNLMDDLICGNTLITTSRHKIPTLSFIATQDSVVPFESADAIENSSKVYLKSGHVGLVTTHSKTIADTIRRYYDLSC